MAERLRGWGLWAIWLDAPVVGLFAVASFTLRWLTHAHLNASINPDEYWYALFAQEYTAALRGEPSLARNLDSDSYHPLVPWLLGLAALLAPREADFVDLGRALQASFNGLVAPATYLLARSCALPRPTSFAAALLAMAVPVLWAEAGSLVPDNQAALLATLFLATLALGLRRRSLPLAVSAGLLLAAAVPTKEHLGLLLPAAAAWGAAGALALRQAEAAALWRWAAWAVGAACAGLLLSVLGWLPQLGFLDSALGGSGQTVGAAGYRPSLQGGDGMAGRMFWLIMAAGVHGQLSWSALSSALSPVGLPTLALASLGLATLADRSVLGVARASLAASLWRAGTAGLCALTLALLVAVAYRTWGAGGALLLLGTGALGLMTLVRPGRPNVLLSSLAAFALMGLLLHAVAGNVGAWFWAEARFLFPLHVGLVTLGAYGLQEVALGGHDALGRFKVGRPWWLPGAATAVVGCLLALLLTPLVERIGLALSGVSLAQDYSYASRDPRVAGPLRRASPWLRSTITGSHALLTSAPVQVNVIMGRGRQGLERTIGFPNLGVARDRYFRDEALRALRVDWLVLFPETSQAWAETYLWLRSRPYLRLDYEQPGPAGATELVVFRHLQRDQPPLDLSAEELARAARESIQRLSDAPLDSLLLRAAAGGSGFGVAWQDYRREGVPKIFFMPLDLGGRPTKGDVLAVDADAGAEDVSVAWDGSVFGLAWSERREARTELSFRRLSPSGEAVGPAVPLTAGFSTGVNVSSPALLWTGQAYALAYDRHESGGNFEVYFQGLDPSGHPTGPPRQVSQTTGASRTPGLAFDGAGFGLSWHETDGSGSAAYLQRLSGDGARLGGPIRLGRAAAERRNLAIAWAGDRYVVAWQAGQDQGSAVLFVAVPPSAAGQVSPRVVDPNAAPARGLAVASTGDQVSLAWHEGRPPRGLRLARLSPRGDLLVGPARADPDSSPGGAWPTLAWGGQRLLLAWSDQRWGWTEAVARVLQD